MIGTYRMKITTLKNENGETVYHVTDDGCIQEFWSYKEAQAFVAYLLDLGLPANKEITT